MNEMGRHRVNEMGRHKVNVMGRHSVNEKGAIEGTRCGIATAGVVRRRTCMTAQDDKRFAIAMQA